MSTCFNSAAGGQFSKLKKMPIANDNFICYRPYSILRIGFMRGGGQVNGEISISTRRFWERPDLSVLEAMGLVSPNPWIEKRCALQPWAITYSATQLALRLDNLRPKTIEMTNDECRLKNECVPSF